MLNEFWRHSQAPLRLVVTDVEDGRSVVHAVRVRHDVTRLSERVSEGYAGGCDLRYAKIAVELSAGLLLCVKVYLVSNLQEAGQGELVRDLAKCKKNYNRKNHQRW
jgi:hypothetical protein